MKDLNYFYKVKIIGVWWAWIFSVQILAYQITIGSFETYIFLIFSLLAFSFEFIKEVMNNKVMLLNLLVLLFIGVIFINLAIEENELFFLGVLLSPCIWLILYAKPLIKKFFE